MRSWHNEGEEPLGNNGSSPLNHFKQERIESYDSKKQNSVGCG